MLNMQIATDITPAQFQPHGARHYTNTGGAEIMLNRSQDGIYYRLNYGQDLSQEIIYEAEIIQDQEGESYFLNHHQEPEYLNEFIAIR
jgi:hypothetical protein